VQREPTHHRDQDHPAGDDQVGAARIVEAAPPVGAHGEQLGGGGGDLVERGHVARLGGGEADQRPGGPRGDERVVQPLDAGRQRGDRVGGELVELRAGFTFEAGRRIQLIHEPQRAHLDGEQLHRVLAAREGQLRRAAADVEAERTGVGRRALQHAETGEPRLLEPADDLERDAGFQLHPGQHLDAVARVSERAGGDGAQLRPVLPRLGGVLAQRVDQPVHRRVGDRARFEHRVAGAQRIAILVHRLQRARVGAARDLEPNCVGADVDGGEHVHARDDGARAVTAT